MWLVFFPQFLYHLAVDSYDVRAAYTTGIIAVFLASMTTVSLRIVIEALNKCTLFN